MTLELEPIIEIYWVKIREIYQIEISIEKKC